MKEMTVLDMVKVKLEEDKEIVSSDSLKRRLQRNGCKPFKYIGSAGIYTDADFAKVREVKLGKPKSDKKPAPKAKVKKTTSKKK